MLLVTVTLILDLASVNSDLKPSVSTVSANLLALRMLSLGPPGNGGNLNIRTNNLLQTNGWLNGNKHDFNAQENVVGEHLEIMVNSWRLLHGKIQLYVLEQNKVHFSGCSVIIQFHPFIKHNFETSGIISSKQWIKVPCESA